MEIEITLRVWAPSFAVSPAGLVEEIVGRLRLDQRGQFETESDGLITIDHTWSVQPGSRSVD